MTVAISFRGVSAVNHFNTISFEIESGCSALIVTSAKNEGTLLLRLITGIENPVEGSVHVFGQSVAGLAPVQLYQMRQQIGVVPSNGGLISNLKVWENISLPLLYSTGDISAEAEQHTVNRLKKLGYSGNIMAMPALLSTYEKRLAAFIRATLIKPSIMLYDHCFEDMSLASQKTFSSAANEFHNTVADRTSVYLMSSQEMAKDLNADVIIEIN